MTEGDLRDLGIHRIPVPIPFPQAGGPVNVYLFEEADGGLLQVDAGIDTDAGHEALEAGFRAIGRRFDEVRRIVVTHGHVDHYGAARWLQERHGGEVPVYAHPLEIPKMIEGGWRWRQQAPAYARHLGRLGVPAEVLVALAKEGEKGFGFAKRVANAHPLGGGELLQTKHVTLEVLHMPGHTPGLLCLYDRAHRILLSDDHLLEKVSPNPLIELGPDGEEGWFQPLRAYLVSLARTRELEIDLVLPGHAAPFTGHRAVIDSLLGFYGKRQAKIRGVLADGPRSGYEVTQALFPHARPGDVYLTISETVANLEVMEARGELTRALVDEVYRYALA
jgi:glyoxylase-like metal-dependent hydrolase (beta-lactamase superfamily II)